MSLPNVRRQRVTRTVAVALVLTCVGAVGCAGQPGTSQPSMPAVATTVLDAPSTTSSEVELADRKTATYFIGQNGGCHEPTMERCIANMLSYLVPQSPAIAPALKAAEEFDRQQLEAFYAAAAAADAAKAAEQAKLESFYRAVATAQAAEATAIRMGESLVESVCQGNGGTYRYWTDPPRAEVVACNAPYQASGDGGGGGRTGAVCVDGWLSSATGSGACSHHGGVAYWTYG